MGAAVQECVHDNQVTVPAQLQLWPDAGSCIGMQHAAAPAVLDSGFLGGCGGVAGRLSENVCVNLSLVCISKRSRGW